jgi:hypothetical protein
LDSSFGHCHQVELLSFSKSLEELLEMIVMGRIPDQTSIPALIDVQKTKGSWSLRKNFPFSMNSRKIHKILFVLSADEPIPQGLIQCVKKVAQPDGRKFL